MRCCCCLSPLPRPAQLTLHLDQELCLDATRRLALVLVPGATQRVHLIDEYDGGLLLASQVKQVLHQSNRNEETRTQRQRGIGSSGAGREEETYFSLSPSHFDMRSEEETEKNVELLASVATALARYDFPVPGGPKSRMPLHGVRLPEKTEVIRRG